MNTFTHLSIAMNLKHYIEKNFNIKLRTISFLYGSIKPDFSLPYINIPHYKKDSENFIFEQIQNIIKTDIYEFEKCTTNFSERLGVITHYLSDFFCYAHTENFTKGMLEHLIYEIHISVYNSKNSKKLNSYLDDKDIVANFSTVSIFNFINDLNSDYLSVCNPANPGIDMTYTLEACSSLCFSIISTCLVSKRSGSSIPKVVLLKNMCTTGK